MRHRIRYQRAQAALWTDRALLKKREREADENLLPCYSDLSEMNYLFEDKNWKVICLRCEELESPACLGLVLDFGRPEAPTGAAVWVPPLKLIDKVNLRHNYGRFGARFAKVNTTLEKAHRSYPRILWLSASRNMADHLYTEARGGYLRTKFAVETPRRGE